ncbi:hypothetical protein QGM71_03645 [Virgibacillus sp. C22-A2]|uniref:FeS cluster biogenesis domain-containing protein n=1 Tax=Virgibacillus tibetensis TaxID=3042313 RepID=A0ABU6KBM5_9BACI|nr:hypothetical protein [Virgibacillus sp. C22-A2]
MQLLISKEAAKWYKSELDIKDTAEHIRFYTRYGFGGHIPGFSLGISMDKPIDIYTSTTIEDITFFVEGKDAWYFEGYDLKINMNRKLQEPEFKYIDKE